MVLDFYNLREQPFGVTPDPKFLYASATHREALASVLYGLEEGRGFVALIAPPGMGKTTLLFHALNQLRVKARVAFVFQTICTPAGFLRAVLSDLGVQEAEGSLVELQAKLNEVVTEQSRLGKPVVIVIDEAQNLEDSVLELARMLSNFETSRQKLIQIVLSGQPQLADKLASPELVQLRQRVSIFASLKSFSAIETALYVEHRLRLAGYSAERPLFTGAALEAIAECSQGIPRNINNLCFNALSLGCALKRTTIDCDIVREVVADLDLETLRERKPLPQAPKWHAVANVRSSRFAVRIRSICLRPLPRFALSCAVLLALACIVVESHWWAAPKVTVRASRAVQPLANARPLSPSSEKMSQPPAPAQMILVTPGETLYRICAERFGGCDSVRFRQIRILNPWLRDMDHIEPGQRIRLPATQDTFGAAQEITGNSGNALPAKRGTQ